VCEIIDVVAREELGLDTGPSGPEVAKDGNQQLFEMVEEGETEQIQLRTGQRVHLGSEFANGSFDALRGRIKGVRGIGRHQARGTSLEQWQAQGVFKGCDTPDDGRLTDASGARGAPGRPLPIERKKHADIVPGKHRELAIHICIAPCKHFD